MAGETFSNLFDFIDYLEGFNRLSGTANENRAFIFNTIDAGFNVVTNPYDLQGAYEAIGISVPINAFQAIADMRLQSGGTGNMIQILAPNSIIPGLDLGIDVGNYTTDYIARYHVTFYDLDIDETLTKKYYLTYDDTFTPSALANAAINDFETKYKVRVTNISLDRVYRTFGNA